MTDIRRVVRRVTDICSNVNVNDYLQDKANIHETVSLYVTESEISPQHKILSAFTISVPMDQRQK